MRSSSRPFLAAYLATTEPIQAQIVSAHAQLVAAFSKEMADVDGEMLAEYGAMDAMESIRPFCIMFSYNYL